MLCIRNLIVAIAVLATPMLAAAQRGDVIELPPQQLQVRSPSYGFGITNEVRSVSSTVVSAQVQPDGRATQVRIARSSGSSRLDTAALQAVRRTRFNGLSADAALAVRVPIQFRLWNTDVVSR